MAIQSQVNAMVGPATSGAVAAASLNAQKTGVPLLTPSGTQDDLTLDKVDGVKKYVFRTTFQDSFQGQVLAQYAFSNLNAKKLFFTMIIQVTTLKELLKNLRKISR